MQLFKILMVEDDPNDLIINTRKISRSKIKYKSLKNVDTISRAKEYLVKEKPDLIFLDLNLPDSSGADTVSEIRKFYDGLLIVLTSLDQEAVGVECIRLGADEFLTKGDFNEKDILSKIQFSVERRKRWQRMNQISCKIYNLELVAEVVNARIK